MGHEKLIAVHSRVGCIQSRRYALRFNLVDATLKLGRVGDVEVVGDAAVLLIKEVIVIIEGL